MTFADDPLRRVPDLRFDPRAVRLILAHAEQYGRTSWLNPPERARMIQGALIGVAHDYACNCDDSTVEHLADWLQQWDPDLEEEPLLTEPVWLPVGGTPERKALVDRLYERTETLWETDGFGPDDMIDALLTALREAQ